MMMMYDDYDDDSQAKIHTTSQKLLPLFKSCFPPFQQKNAKTQPLPAHPVSKFLNGLMYRYDFDEARHQVRIGPPSRLEC